MIHLARVRMGKAFCRQVRGVKHVYQSSSDERVTVKYGTERTLTLLHDEICGGCMLVLQTMKVNNLPTPKKARVFLKEQAK